MFHASVTGVRAESQLYMVALSFQLYPRVPEVGRRLRPEAGAPPPRT